LRFSLIIITAIVLAFGSLAAPAHAQFEDLSGILEDIMGGPMPGQTPFYGETAIETIPVLIRYDMDTDFDEHILVVSAYTPTDPSGGSKKAQMLGQTRLLMTGLQQPLQVTLSVPRTVTKDLTFARITAEILDENQNQVLTTDRDGIYRGHEALELTLKSTLNTRCEAMRAMQSTEQYRDLFVRTRCKVDNTNGHRSNKGLRRFSAKCF